MTSSSFRIRSSIGKVAYWAVVLAIGSALGGTVFGLLPIIPRTIAGELYTLAVVWIGTRIFRGRHESTSPRPVWRATAGTTSAVVVGILFTLWSIKFVNDWVGAVHSSVEGSASSAAIHFVVTSALATFYFRSAFICRRLTTGPEGARS